MKVKVKTVKQESFDVEIEAAMKVRFLGGIGRDLGWQVPNR